MSIKPFYIRGLTKEQQQVVLEKSLQAGANLYNLPSKYNPVDDLVDGVEIAIEDLDTHLGLVSEQYNKCTELRNVKIDLRKEDGTVDEELSKRFQEAVVASGGRWYGGQIEINVITPYIFVYKDGIMTISSSDRIFKKKELKQITFKQITTWEAEYIPEAPVNDSKDRKVVQLSNGTKVYEDELQMLVQSSNLTEVK